MEAADLKNLSITEDSDNAQCSPSSLTYLSHLASRLDVLCKKDKLTDVMLVAEGRSIPCHKVVLAAASDFFQRKLISEDNESGDVIHNLLEIENIEFSTLKQVVDYIYTGSLGKDISLEAARKLAIASSMLLLQHLQRKCEELLIADVNIASCVSMNKFGKRYGLTSVSDEARRLMHDHFEEVVSAAEFLEMRMDELIEYIGSNGLCVTNENPVYQAVVRWVTHDIKARQDNFPSILDHVRLSFCSPEFLRDVVAPDSLTQNLACKNLLVDAFIQQSRGSSSTLAVTDTTPRRGYGKNRTLIMIGNLDDEVNQTNEWWILKDGDWEEMVPRPLCSGDIGACLLEDGILITGGDEYEGPTFKECWLLSTKTLQWSRLPDMKSERSRHQSVYCEGHAYVFGGCGQHVERLKKDRSQWVSMPKMPEGRTNAAGVGYGSLIYICGGDKPDHVWESTDTMFEFNTLSKVWNERAPMPVKTRSATALVFRKNIYVVGGKENCCLSYSVGENQWTEHSPSTIGCTWSTAVVWRGSILICGGDSHDTAGEPDFDRTNYIEQYDEKNNAWSLCKLRLPKGTLKRYLFCTEIPRDIAVNATLKEESYQAYRPRSDMHISSGRRLNYRGQGKSRGARRRGGRVRQSRNEYNWYMYPVWNTDYDS